MYAEHEWYWSFQKHCDGHNDMSSWAEGAAQGSEPPEPVVVVVVVDEVVVTVVVVLAPYEHWFVVVLYVHRLVGQLAA